MRATPLDQPALRGLGKDEPAPADPVDGKFSKALVQFRDGTLRLCRIAGWKQDRARAWWCLLRWGVSGELHEAWYVYDEGKMRPAGDPPGGDG